MNKTLIEINGISYDASTGRPIHALQASSSPAVNIDGVIAQPRSRTRHLIQAKPVHMLHKKQAHKSQTLMRNAVRKPYSPSTPAPEHSTAVKHTHSSSSYQTATQHHERLTKAQSVPTHHAVSKFSRSTPAITPTLSNIPVVKESVLAPSVAQPFQVPQPKLHNYRTSPSEHYVQAQLAQAQDVEHESPFKKQPLLKRITGQFRSRKLLSLGATLGSVLLVGGFLVYQNLSTITLAVASRQAGISARVPEGIPSNFRMERDIHQSPGQITVSFVSRTDDRAFALTQQKSQETVKSLQEAVNASTKGQYQTYEANGITLFITGPGKADWIDGSMRYSLSGSSGLTSEQLASIASSL
jgi:hypothetical protein